MSQRWHVYRKGQQSGPFSREQILELINQGNLERGDLVWTQGMSGWASAGQVQGLFPDDAGPPMPPPVRPSGMEQAPSQGQVRQTPSPADRQAAPSAGEKKTSTGLEPNIAALLSYILGWLSGLIFLLLEKDNAFVRFHAMQSIIFSGAVTVLMILISVGGSIIFTLLWRIMGLWTIANTLNLLLSILSWLLWLLTIVAVVIAMIKAYQHEAFKLPIAGKIAEKQLH